MQKNKHTKNGILLSVNNRLRIKVNFINDKFPVLYITACLCIEPKGQKHRKNRLLSLTFYLSHSFSLSHCVESGKIIGSTLFPE